MRELRNVMPEFRPCLISGQCDVEYDLTCKWMRSIGGRASHACLAKVSAEIFLRSMKPTWPDAGWGCCVSESGATAVLAIVSRTGKRFM